MEACMVKSVLDKSYAETWAAESFFIGIRFA